MPPDDGAAQVPSPLQNVELLALMPLLRCDTPRLPVIPDVNGKPVQFVSVPDAGVPSAPELYRTVPPLPRTIELPSVPVRFSVFDTVSVLPLAMLAEPGPMTNFATADAWTNLLPLTGNNVPEISDVSSPLGALEIATI